MVCIVIQLCVMPIFTAIMVLNQLINFARRDFFSMAKHAIIRIMWIVKLNVNMVREFSGVIVLWLTEFYFRWRTPGLAWR